MIRRVGNPPQSGIRYRLRPGAYAILPRGGSVLLTLQSGSDEALQLPGGGIDPGESPLCALYREVLEETGWRIAKPRRLGAFRRFVYMPDYGFWAEKLCTIYIAHPGCAVSAPTEPGHSAVIVPVEEAIERLGNVGDRRFLHTAFRQGLIT